MKTSAAIAGLLLGWIPAASGDVGSPRPDGSVLFMAGQSREEFADYLERVTGEGRLTPLPAGASFYTSLDLNGITAPHANVPGDFHQDLWYLKTVYQPLVIQVGLWLSREQLPAIAAGHLDAQVGALADHLRKLDRPVLLRIGYEFDGPHNRYPPRSYVDAYRVIAAAMRAASPRILLVWHSFAMLPTYQEIDVLDWYPGDSVVDWLAISFFQVGDEGYHAAPNRDRILEIARAKGKPVLVAEASAIRYTARQKQLSGKAYWDYWYRPFLELVESSPEIRAVSLINVDWDSQKQHQVLDWGDARIHADAYVLEQWRQRMRSRYWLHRGDSVYRTVLEGLGPTPRPRTGAGEIPGGHE